MTGRAWLYGLLLGAVSWGLIFGAVYGFLWLYSGGVDV